MHVQDNYPTMRTVASDLSPFYLSDARSNMAYWQRQRAAGQQLGGTDGSGTDFMQCAAENVPAPDGSFDVVSGAFVGGMCGICELSVVACVVSVGIHK